MFHITTYSKTGSPTKIDVSFPSVEAAQQWVMNNCFKHKSETRYVPSIRWIADFTDGQISRLVWDRPANDRGVEHMIYINEDLSTIFIDRADIDEEVRIDRLHETMFSNDSR